MANDTVDLIGITTTGDVQVFNGSGQSIIITTGSASPINDGLVMMSATDSVPGYIASKIGAGLVVSGTNLVAVVTTLDGKILANATDASANYLQSKIGVGLAASGTNVIVATNLFSILNYGVATNTGAAVSISSLKIAFGITPTGKVTAITGLPFSNGTSYSVSVALNAYNTATNIGLCVTATDGASMEIRISETESVQWIAIGV